MPGVGWKEKSKTLTRDYSEYGESDSWALLISWFRWYPDRMLDIFRSDDAKYDTELVQRMLLRAFARYQFVTITGSRGMTKTTCVTQYHICQNILWPGTKTSYYGPSYKQQAELAKVAFHDVENDYPALTEHYNVEAESKDTWSISTKFGSNVSINAIRGKNIHDVTAEEFAQSDGFGNSFDFDEYTTVVLYAVRLLHMVQGERDRTYIPYKQRAITSAGSKQNHAFETRCNHLRMMRQGKSAFVMDIPWTVVVLSQMRPYEWAMQRKAESTPDKWMREMESRYSGTAENPIVTDEVLTDCQKLAVMEDRHCCKMAKCRLAPEDVIYVIGYDVSYAEGKKNAKCAAVVLKLTRQREFLKKDKYLKQVVYVDDWPPPANSTLQARKLKQLWYRYCFEGSETYIAIDAWQYGSAVLADLMLDLGDGLAPLCIYEHDSLVEMEHEGAIPVIYPIKAGGVGLTDPDSEMVRNAELQFDNGNVELLYTNQNEGVEAYKRAHSIRDDYMDHTIAIPYRKTRELVAQIQNLKKVPSGAGISERRISKKIQRDSWSALKYALRFAQRLERKNLQKEQRRSDWDAELDRYRSGGTGGRILSMPDGKRGRMAVRRTGGRVF